MHRRSWLIPITVCIVCSVILLSYQRTAAATPEGTRYAEPVTFTNKNMASHVMGIYFKNGSTIIDASRTGHDWTVHTPATFDANSSYIHNNLTKLFTASHLEVIATHSIDLGHYGIGDYTTELSLTFDSGDVFTLIKGAAIDDNLTYAYDETNHVLYQVSSQAFNYFSRSIEDWYEKDYIDFDLTTTSQITLAFDGSTHVIENTKQLEDETVYTTPFISDSLNDTQVNIILDFLSSSRVEKLITLEASETAVSNYGFNENTITITISNKDGHTQSLVISTTFFSDHYTYVFLPTEGTILAIPSFSFIGIADK